MSYIGLDIGTTGCKAVIFNELWEIAGQASREYHILRLQPGWAEQNAEVVYQLSLDALKQALSQVNDDPPKALSLSVQGEAVIPVDNNGMPLRPAILGMDTRTTEENKWLEEQFGADYLFKRTGIPVHTINTLPKLLWLQKHEREIWKKADQFLLYEDFILRRLCGTATISHCLASRTQMYDLKTGTWATDILDRCNIEPHRLAQFLTAKNGIAGEMGKELAASLGIKNKVLLVCGGHDQACAALGSGVVQPGLAMVSTGTAEVVEVAMNEPVLNESLRDSGISVYKHVVPDLYLAMTLNHSGGLMLRWFRDKFCQQEIEQGKRLEKDPYEIILEDLSDGPSPLFVLPHFAGSGTPFPDTKSKGAMLGFDFSSGINDITKAILEGLTFELRNNIDLLRKSGIKIEKMHAVGGGAKSPFWLQLKADICKAKISVPAMTEAACLGAGILAAAANGAFANIKTAVDKIVEFKKQFYPREPMSDIYEKRYNFYKKIYPMIKDFNHLL